MIKEKLNRLIKIADYLDSQNMVDDADFIDNMIKNSEIELEIPEDEWEQINAISKALNESLSGDAK